MTTIYESDIDGSRIIFDADAHTLTLDSPVAGVKVAEKPDDWIGAFTGREIVEGWLKTERIMSMSGKWVYDNSRHEENRKEIKQWLNI